MNLFAALFSRLVFFALIVLAAPTVRAQTTRWEFKTLKWDKSHAGTRLDLSAYKETFRDDFNTLDITAADGTGPWYAAVHKPFGAGIFVTTVPGPRNTYSVDQGMLTLRSEKVNGQWQSGLIQTVDRKGHGFAQQYGYFEMRAKFPPGAASWPAFWLLTQNGFLDHKATRGEIDIVEWYGNDPKHHHTTIHLWPAAELQPGAFAKHAYDTYVSSLGSAVADGEIKDFHTYGAEITPDWIIMYLDRKELARIKTVPEYKTPVYLVVNLAIGEKQADQTPGPLEMKIDYVTAYAHK